nr:hypothetical protein Iba_chr02bCG0160 [Ipomoea batatas]GMC62050.1 hypothetical protein Iba_chr02cCG0200 [Ipomoea batatas]GMD06686.1 hypothetical protein Iba_scaffold39512CG0010 [Ipomoea batatas]
MTLLAAPIQENSQFHTCPCLSVHMSQAQRFFQGYNYLPTPGRAESNSSNSFEQQKMYILGNW